MSSWKPIETAPRSYTPILLKQDESVGEGWYASHLDTWEFANSQHVMRRAPTHWMPLPEGPSMETDVVPHPDADKSSVPHPAENTSVCPHGIDSTHGAICGTCLRNGGPL